MATRLIEVGSRTLYHSISPVASEDGATQSCESSAQARLASPRLRRVEEEIRLPGQRVAAHPTSSGVDRKVVSRAPSLECAERDAAALSASLISPSVRSPPSTRHEGRRRRHGRLRSPSLFSATSAYATASDERSFRRRS
ncbi:hypothetical protein MTO96_009581 [Rhipicephalus appendiculatus]